jgi:ribosome biogenesis GTPase / thiamine phosphate phosphatase
MNLIDLGWSQRWEASFEQFRKDGLAPARVAREDRDLYQVYSESGELVAEVTGRFRFRNTSRADFPAVGDWVAIEASPSGGRVTIHAVLPRVSKFSRKVAGTKTEEQVVAANIDTAFIVCGLDGDFNPRRIERYLTPAWNSGAAPVVVLNKADVAGDIAPLVTEVESVAFGVPVYAISALARSGVEVLLQYCSRGKTVALLGSSGVGKSTLINALLGEEQQQTGVVSEHQDRGRHTTTRRELVLLPSGGMIIDNPGMRELQLWSDGEEGLDETFDDIRQLGTQCRFRDCQHDSEPDCAVQAALIDGTLASERYQSYLKIKRELRYVASRQDQRLRAAERARWKQIAKTNRARTKAQRL